MPLKDYPKSYWKSQMNTKTEEPKIETYVNVKPNNLKPNMFYEEANLNFYRIHTQIDRNECLSIILICYLCNTN